MQTRFGRAPGMVEREDAVFLNGMHVREIAAKMVAKCVLNLRMTKETINRDVSASLYQAIQLGRCNQVLCLSSRSIVNPLKTRL